MDVVTEKKNVPTSRRGAYTANLLGNIKSHLAGLQGYDVMALELVQNADDAKADEIIFDVTDRGLVVTNSARFTYCGDLNAKPCSFKAERDYSCDYHRIADVGSAGKLAKPENIGRFGIGFVSTYQITDHPEIRSAGVKLTLLPEQGECDIDSDVQGVEGTRFFLPWARDAESEGRLALGVSSVTAEHIERLVQDFEAVLRRSLFFLRHVCKAELRRDGKLIFSCDLQRDDPTSLRVTFQPGRTDERWFILRVDAAEAVKELISANRQLERLKRNTNVTIALRVEPEPLSDGLLYAFLPTEQSTGLPLHINADFFPESDRKALIFKGNQHEQLWNEMLIATAARQLAAEVEHLTEVIGLKNTWNLIGRAYDLSHQSGYPSCFKCFWDEIQKTVKIAPISYTHDGTKCRPDELLLPRSVYTPAQKAVLVEIGARLVHDDLSKYQLALTALGAKLLTFERLVELLVTATKDVTSGAALVDQKRLEAFYVPLWGLVNGLMPESTTSVLWQSTLNRLKAVAFIVAEGERAYAIQDCHAVAAGVDPRRAADVFRALPIVSRHMETFPRLAALASTLTLEEVATHLEQMLQAGRLRDALAFDPATLRKLYSILAELDRAVPAAQETYKRLKSLPIWLTFKGVGKAEHTLLPGNFTDPTGTTELLEPSALTDAARAFVSTKLAIPTQSISAFVRTALPRFFSVSGPADATKHRKLVLELASHPSLLDDDVDRQTLATLPLVPTRDGRWTTATQAYRRSNDLVKVFGENGALWIDEHRLPDARSVWNFIVGIGLCQRPTAEHLVDRMVALAEDSSPTEDIKRAASEAFYALCDDYEKSEGKESYQDAIERLRHERCFPADGDSERWYKADELHAPFRAEAFSSQAKILDFRATNRLKTELLDELGVTTTPETQLVIQHLRHCVKEGMQPNLTTYQILSERARSGDPRIVELRNERCVYVAPIKRFVLPSMVYWTPQQLGRYAYTIPSSMEMYKAFFDAINVKASPEAHEFTDILLEIVGDHYEKAKAVVGPDRSVYSACLAGLATAHVAEELSKEDLGRLKEAPTIINSAGNLLYPSDALIRDSEWHASFFEGELDATFTLATPDLWPLLEVIGVKRLSECSQISLAQVEGASSVEQYVEEHIASKAELLARLFYNKSTALATKVRNAFSTLRAVSHDAVHIQATVPIGDHQFRTPARRAVAFYDSKREELVLARPVGDKSWTHILTAIFHQLMPEQSATEVSILTLGISHLMSMSSFDAHQHLTEVGVPLLPTMEQEPSDDLASTELGKLGLDEQFGGVEDGAEDNDEMPLEGAAAAGNAPIVDKKRTALSSEADEGALNINGSATQGKLDSNRGGGVESTALGSDRSGDGGAGAAVHKTPGGKSRPKYKDQWDKRLLSYVRKKAQETAGEVDTEDHNQHNLEVEALSRAAVCSYEKARGRTPEEMPQTHPGYDIISSDAITGEVRYIEVKGVRGGWNAAGVGLSKMQFGTGQEHGERYWLYVVEFAMDEKHTEVHAIHNPFEQVTYFMFDENWREAAAEETPDPTQAFIVGARVRQPVYGLGTISEVHLRNGGRVLVVDYDDGKRRPVTLRLAKIEVVNDE